VDKYEDIADQYDPQATGGKKQPVSRGNRHADKAA
jgi:hypothetical protein